MTPTILPNKFEARWVSTASGTARFFSETHVMQVGIDSFAAAFDANSRAVNPVDRVRHCCSDE
jgi:hypothetical protein